MASSIGFESFEASGMLDTYSDDVIVARTAYRLDLMARIFIALLLVKSAAYLVTGEMLISNWAKLFTVPLLMVIVCFLILASRLLASGSLEAGRATIMAVISIAAVVSVVLCGGFVSSDYTLILLFPIALGFSIMPLRQAHIWFASIILIPLIVDIGANYFGFSLPDFSGNTSAISYTVTMTGTLIAVTYVCLSFMILRYRDDG